VPSLVDGPLLIGRITYEAGLYRLKLISTAMQQVRELSASNCGELADAAALITTLALVQARDDGAYSSEEYAEPSEVPSPPSLGIPEHRTSEVPVTKGVLEKRPSRTSSPGPTPSPSLFIGGGWAHGVYPTSAFGIIAGAALGLGRFQAAVRGSFYPPRTLSISQSATARWQLFGVSLRGCWFGYETSSEFRLALCATGFLGRLHGSTSGLHEVGAGATSIAQLGLGPSIHIPLGHKLRLELCSSMLILVTPVNFNVDGIGAIHQPSAFSSYASVGLDWSL
jgi:hypothetical protein